MAQFRFRLARVLEWYEERCTLERDKLRARIEELAAVTADIKRIRGEVTQARADMANLQSVQPAELLALARYGQRAEQEIVHRLESQKQAELALKLQTEAVQAATRQLRLLERLRDRRLSEYRHEMDVELEQLAADAFRSASFREPQGH